MPSVSTVGSSPEEAAEAAALLSSPLGYLLFDEQPNGDDEYENRREP